MGIGAKTKGSISLELEDMLSTDTVDNVVRLLADYMNTDELHKFYLFVKEEKGLEEETIDINEERD